MPQFKNYKTGRPGAPCFVIPCALHRSPHYRISAVSSSRVSSWKDRKLNSSARVLTTGRVVPVPASDTAWQLISIV